MEIHKTKYLLIVIIFATYCVINVSAGISAFKKTFKDLHQPPPPPEIKGRSTISIGWIEQKLNNFDKKNNETWQMRYMSSNQWFKEGGPIFIFVGGEWTISPGYLQGGHMYDMAKEMNGYMFYTEHRYYGESHPTADLSVENLKYLSVEQALADLEHFVTTMKEINPELRDSGVIVVGGSYSATMVTWFRQFYSKVACGAWASSAPLLAKVDFVEYKEIVGQSIALIGGKECHDRIERSIATMESLIKSNDTERLKKLLQSCEIDLENNIDIWSLFGEISDLFAGLVQGHNAGNIEKACKTILSDEDDLEGVTKWIRSAFSTEECIDFSYKSAIKELGNVNYTSSPMRQWFYQTCSEFGWYQTSGSKNQPFGSSFPVELYIQLCQDLYGISNQTLYSNIEVTNKRFGGMKPRVENVYFTHGHLDPWRAMGVQETLNEKSEATVIPNYAHCKDLASINDSDTEEMQAAKLKVTQLVMSWLYPFANMQTDNKTRVF